MPIAAAAVISFSAAYFTKGKSETTKKQQLEPWPEVRRHLYNSQPSWLQPAHRLLGN